MAARTNIVMSWSKCKIEVGKTGESDAMATTLKSLGVINDKSTSLSTEDGEVMEAKATGGVTVAYEEGEHSYIISTRIKEMDFETEASIIKGEVGTDGELIVKSNIVAEDYSVKVTPKNIGAIGIKARRTHMTFKPGSSEEEGHFVDVTFRILECVDGELYKKFRVTDADWAE